METFQRHLAQIDPLRQPEAVELVQMMSQRRIDLCLGGRRIEDVLISHALLSRQLHRQEEQRRNDSLLRSFLEVVPVKESHDETELGKAELCAIAARIG